MENAVGPVLRMNDEVDLVVQAIRDDNPDAPIEVIDRGAYVRIQGPGYLKVTRTSLERQLGRDFPMRELEGMLTAFAGRIHTSSDEISWQLTVAPAERKDMPVESEPPVVEDPRPTGPVIPMSLHNRAARTPASAATNGGN